MNIQKQYKGIIMIIFSAFFFSLMAVFVRLSGDLPSIQKSFFRNIVAAFFAAAILVKDGNGFSFKRENLPFLVLRSVFGTVGLICNFYAIDKLVLADANMLNKMSPFFAVIASALFLKEKLRPHHIAAITAALAGAVLIIKPSFSNILLGPAIIGLTGGLGAGLAYTAVRYLGQRGERGPVIVFFFSTFSCLVCLPFIVFDYTPMSLYQLAMLILAGLMAAFGQFTVTAAYFYAPANEISVYDYTAVIFSTIWGFAFFRQTPDVCSIIGYFLICGAAAANFIKNKKHSK